MKRLLVIALLVAACGSTTPSPSGAPRGSTAPAASTPADTTVASPKAGPAYVGDYAPIVLKGKGNKTVPFDIPEDSIAIALLSHPGGGKFEVAALGEDGTQNQQLVKLNGKYKGTVLFDLVDHSTAFKVTAKGPWTITVKPSDAASVWNVAKPLKGKGDAVVVLSTPSQDKDTLTFKISGPGAYTVRAHSPDDDVSLLNGTAPAKATKALPEGTEILEIRSTGSWTATLAHG